MTTYRSGIRVVVSTSHRLDVVTVLGPVCAGWVRVTDGVWTYLVRESDIAGVA